MDIDQIAQARIADLEAAQASLEAELAECYSVIARQENEITDLRSEVDDEREQKARALIYAANDLAA